MNAKCTDSTGYCYNSKIGSYSSLLSNSGEVFKIMTNELKKELLEMRPKGNFEVVSFNRV
jgi:hypothetical protein